MSSHSRADDSSPAPRKPRVLVVDDSRFARRLIRGILVNSGYDVVGEAADGQQALVMCERIRPDVMTLDYDMPRLNGEETLRILRRHNDIPVIIVTGFPDILPDLRRSLNGLNVTAIVNKSFTENSVDLSYFTQSLISALDNALPGSRLIESRNPA